MPASPPVSHLRRAALLALASACTSVLAQAPAWPAKPITLVVPFPAGGGTDLVARALQPRLQKELGQPLVIDNRAGAGGTVGSAAVARAAADGYTAGVATTSTHAVSVSVYPKLPFDPAKDFSYAGFIGTSPYVLATTGTLGKPDTRALLAALKARPEGFSFASVGAGTVSHLLGEQFKGVAGTALVHVPYRGAAPAYTDLIAGQVQLMFDNPAGLAPYIRAGRVHAVATTAPNALLTGVPTFQQQGLPGFDQSLWYGIVFPAQTPKAVVERFNHALNTVLADRAVSAELAALGVNAAPGTPGALQAAVVRDTAYWGRIAKAVGARVD
ncbi:tripartite-type tricarboxylate transporter receptor subunit TctC [Acidovorax soli]|uniref:Tripartite-type tricarboxylate transporter receptor subunit TctC n=1 Tax=Acidovorax soli TaxID=592050 RepID=A0A7X0PLB1_9BURK|nr:tripartite tricarboxylate transporter substrate-binding protein [Acidovorax soli]MBB6563874.1 tripartite-type tricarboxylate transporter receptor subunit TctC [Acidovorax soli]